MADFGAEATGELRERGVEELLLLPDALVAVVDLDLVGEAGAVEEVERLGLARLGRRRHLGRGARAGHGGGQGKRGGWRFSKIPARRQTTRGRHTPADGAQ